MAEAYERAQDQELYKGTTLPFDSIDAGVDATTSQELASNLARLNGEICHMPLRGTQQALDDDDDGGGDDGGESMD